MQPAVRCRCLALVASLGSLLLSGHAAAAPNRITGKLDKPGFTVIAIADSGKARSAATRRGRFRLRPPASRVTLHLRGADGVYAGPIVVGRRGRRAIVGVRRGARLGAVRVGRGYARVARSVRRGRLVVTRTARARRGVPIGARVFGRVGSKPPRGAPRADRDVDGVPNTLDIDDDGDRVLDSLDRSGRARGAQAGVFAFEHNLGAELNETVNANAAGITPQQVDAFLSSRGTFVLAPPRGDTEELDCGRVQSRTDPLLRGLRYCSRGGSGRLVRIPGNSDPIPFPGCCDSDGDGFGTIPRSGRLLLHGATTAQIGTGDVLIARVTNGGVETQYPATLGYVPATVPALVSYNDGRGNSATVSYPVAGPMPGTGIGGGPGTRSNPFPVTARANGDIVLTLRFWRPQRRPIPPETAQWIDIGRLIYEAGAGDPGRDCPQTAFSTTDGNLAPAPLLPIPPGEAGTGGVADRATDRPASRSSTFTYTLNLTRCLGSEGWSLGQTKPVTLRGTDRLGYASQDVFFRRR